MFDEDISKAMRCSRWSQIKRVDKLNDNRAKKKKGDPGYNPAYKYDMLFDVITHNVNAITLCADLDGCGDETTFPYQGYGEAGSGLVQRIKKKPGVTKGAQLVMVTDVHRIRPSA